MSYMRYERREDRQHLVGRCSRIPETAIPIAGSRPRRSARASTIRTAN